MFRKNFNSISKIFFDYSIAEFEKLTAPFRIKSEQTKDGDEKINFPEGLISDAEWKAQEQKTMRQLRIAELLQQHSKKSDLIVL